MAKELDKIRTVDELKSIVKKLKSENEKIVFTNGCFDLIHLGHIRYLREAKKLGDVLIVGLNSDRSVRELKGPKRPLVPQEERAEIIASLEFVDYIVIFDEKTAENLILELRPDLQVKGGDYRVEEIKEKNAVESYGGKVKVVPYVKGYSTTAIVEEILKKYV